MTYNQYWREINEKEDELSSLFSNYWHQYSDFGTWQFWLILVSLIIPLIILCFTVEKRRVFEVFFFGYTVHVLWTYANIMLERSGYIVHTYYLTPLLPTPTNITASILPVGFLLLYQYCTKHRKNFYLYSVVISVIFAFGLASIEEKLKLLNIRNEKTLIYLYITDVVIAFVAYWFTKFLLKVRNRM
ncbi:hypothetical protein [Priestia endophytica]|jgi:hypothetical protein|uniref:hypothetical protein n=1 Tax=Priestia endophytica TaxID=135735 RepID=UPI000F52B430|nr:hypothetical protein [Priestia endophytica]MED4072123.1 hypothetical protein [Priestia endophytica]RPK09591.1 hypothetical protein FH5_04454 [Priestia endophytica]